MQRTIYLLLVAINYLCVLEASPLVALLLAEEISTTPVVTSVRLDGAPVTAPEIYGAELPYGIRDVEIEFTVPRNADSTRLRYKLEEYDAKWSELPSAFQISLVFYDKRDLRLDSPSLRISGTSRGWGGSVESSDFTERCFEVVAPEGVDHFSLEWQFAHDPNVAVLGEYAFKDIRVETVGLNDQRRQLDLPIESNTANESLGQVPSTWRKDGSGLLVSPLNSLPDKKADHALRLRANHIQSLGVWTLEPKLHPKVGPNEKIRVTWKECYSIGAGGVGKAEYLELKPGRYNFQVQALTAAGQPIGNPSHMPLVVRPPAWQERWFWVAAMLAVGCVSVWISKSRKEQRLIRSIAAAEKRRTFETERVRISQDIHDDLGAGLAQIAMLSELIKADGPESEEWKTHVEQIFKKAHESGRKLDEIVWAINPAHDSAEDLVTYIARFAQEYLALARVRLRLDIPPMLPPILLTATKRHQVFLAVKEAFHNAVKHGAPTEIMFRVGVDSNRLTLTIEDNGCGFVDKSPDQLTRGSAGMLTRLRNINGTFSRQSEPGRGTTVVFSIPIPSIQ